jgi:hypothetical protein
MMTFDQWMKETQRGILTVRSPKLKAVDKAFGNLARLKTPQSEVQLAEKLRLWLDSKGAAWKQSTRNSTKIGGKGTVERLVEDLSASPLCRQKLGPHAVKKPIASLGSKIIVFSGHGSWEVKKDSYVQLPAKCSIKFYTMNMKTLSDGLGGDIDRGIIAGLRPDQEAGPHRNIPDMRLYPPHGLHIRQPNPATWQVVTLPAPVPSGNKNLQVQINDQYGGGASLSVMFQLLMPAIRSASSVTFLWAACRAIGLKDTGGEKIGVNVMQR